jgi:hypothetical protein
MVSAHDAHIHVHGQNWAGHIHVSVVSNSAYTMPTNDTPWQQNATMGTQDVLTTTTRVHETSSYSHNHKPYVGGSIERKTRM